jgi:hypothetical protein
LVQHTKMEKYQMITNFKEMTITTLQLQQWYFSRLVLLKSTNFFYFKHKQDYTYLLCCMFLQHFYSLKERRNKRHQLRSNDQSAVFKQIFVPMEKNAPSQHLA